MTWMNIGRILLVCSLFATWWVPVTAQVLETGADPYKSCYSDQAGAALRKAYPQGAPGRKVPAPARVERVGVDLTYYIPVVVHILHAFGVEQDVTPEQVESQINVMNEGFGGYGDGYNENPLGGKSYIRFCLAKVDPDGNQTLGYEYIPSEYATELDPVTEDTLMKRLTIWDPNRYMNIWTVRSIAGGYEGYTFVPSEVAGTVWDGIILRHSSFGVFPAGTSLTFGNTMTHEAGHYLGLYHPWGLEETVCSFEGTDFCDDTPPVPEIYFSQWPACDAPEACDGNLRLVANYMDYSDDACQNMFTKCQVARMLDNLLTYRSEMVTGNNLLLTGCASIADTLPATDSIYVYPVPATSYLTVNVDFGVVGPALIELVDVTGRRVYRDQNASFGRGPIAIDVSQLSQGIYTLRVWTDKMNVQRRVRIGN
jgi:hypothetical protein